MARLSQSRNLGWDNRATATLGSIPTLKSAEAPVREFFRVSVTLRVSVCSVPFYADTFALGQADPEQRVVFSDEGDQDTFPYVPSGGSQWSEVFISVADDFDETKETH